MDNFSVTTSSEEEEENLFCHLCKENVIHNSKNNSFNEHILNHLTNNEKCSTVVYFSNMPIEDTPKSRGFITSQPARRARTFSGPLHQINSRAPPRPPHFIHSPSSQAVPMHKPRSSSRHPRINTLPGRSVHTEPTNSAAVLSTIPLKSRNTYPNLIEVGDERENLIFKDETNERKKKNTLFHDAEFHVLTKFAEIECPKCKGQGPFLCVKKATGNIFCLSSCLAPFLPFISCCLPDPKFETRVCCSRCKHLLMVFDPSERWLVVK